MFRFNRLSVSKNLESIGSLLAHAWASDTVNLQLESFHFQPILSRQFRREFFAVNRIIEFCMSFIRLFHFYVQ
jgi:hypothetical protein